MQDLTMNSLVSKKRLIPITVMEGAFKDLTGYWGAGMPDGLAHYEGGIGCRQQSCCLILCANAVYRHGTLLPDV